jgi:hypothetical protein
MKFNRQDYIPGHLLKPNLAYKMATKMAAELLFTNRLRILSNASFPANLGIGNPFLKLIFLNLGPIKNHTYNVFTLTKHYRPQYSIFT